jgi:hypothetical protein
MVPGLWLNEGGQSGGGGAIVISGGAGQLPLVRQLLADATGVAVAASRSAEPVLLGAAILGAVAAGGYPNLATAMPAMSPTGRSLPLRRRHAEPGMIDVTGLYSCSKPLAAPSAERQKLDPTRRPHLDGMVGLWRVNLGCGQTELSAAIRAHRR